MAQSRDPDGADDWIVDSGTISRVHNYERKKVFVPVNLSDGNECPVETASLIPRRITVVNSPKKMVIVDDWTGDNAALAPRQLKKRWKG